MSINYTEIGHVCIRCKHYDGLEDYYSNQLGSKKGFDLQLKDDQMPPYTYPKFDGGETWLWYYKLAKGQFIEFFVEKMFPFNVDYVSDNRTENHSYLAAGFGDINEENILSGKAFEITSYDPENNGYVVPEGQLGRIEELKNIILTCRHYEETKKFYQEDLDLELVGTWNFTLHLIELFQGKGYHELKAKEGDEFCAVYKVSGDQNIVLLNVPFNEVTNVGDQGFLHSCLMVSDIVETAKHLEAHKVTPYMGPTMLGWVMPMPYPEDPIAAGKQGQCGSLAIYVRDPEGNDVELMQYTKDSLQKIY